MDAHSLHQAGFPSHMRFQKRSKHTISAQWCKEQSKNKQHLCFEYIFSYSSFSIHDFFFAAEQPASSYNPAMAGSLMPAQIFQPSPDHWTTDIVPSFSICILESEICPSKTFLYNNPLSRSYESGSLRRGRVVSGNGMRAGEKH